MTFDLGEPLFELNVEKPSRKSVPGPSNPGEEKTGEEASAKD